MPALIDSTLREGEQSVGVGFSPASRLEIVRLLAALGIEEIELGIAAPRNRSQLAELLGRCRPPQTPRGAPRLALWCRCRAEDIALAAELRPDVLSLSIPTSDLHLTRRLGQSREWAAATLPQAITLARQLGIGSVSVGFEDASRAEPHFLEELARLVHRAGGERLRLADTVGILSPAKMADLVRRLLRVTPLAVGVHAHNDFGMATANTVAAFEAGAEWGDAAVLGLGERAGMARLEEVAGYLTLGSQENGYRTQMLKPLCATVARAAGRAIAANHPVVGEAVFTCETGLHLQGLLRDPATYEPFAPERVGSARRLLFGAKTGRRAVEEALRANDQMVGEAGVETLVSAIRGLATAQPPLTTAELVELGLSHPLPPGRPEQVTPWP